MLARLRTFWELIRETGDEFVDDHVTKLSASLAYYTIFSIGPLLLVIINVIGFFVKRKDATNHLFEQIGQFIGPDSAAQLETMITKMNTGSNSRLFSIIGILVFVFSATSIFTEMQSSINYIWSIKAKPKRSWLKYITDRLLSFVIIIGGGIVMIASLLLNVILDTIAGQLEHFEFLQKYLGGADIILFTAINTGILFVIVTSLFALIFTILPDARMHWKDTLAGASFTGVLFLIGKFLITWYLGSSKLISAYGAAASLIILLSWIYYSALILYFGAEFTDVYARKCGRGVRVKKTAVFIIKREAKEMPSLKTHVNEDLG